MLRDLRLAVRRLRREPGFALLTVVTLALGLGATTAMAAAVNAAFLKPLPYPDEVRLARIYEASERRRDIAVPYPVVREWAAGTQTCSALAGYMSGAEVNVSDGVDASRARLSRVSAGFFDVMQVMPVRGRTFGSAELQVGAAPAVVISHAVWQRLLGGRADVLSQSIRINGVPVPILGVMPEGFAFPDESGIWAALEREKPEEYGTSTAHNFSVVARLKPGTSTRTVEEELTGVIRRMALTDGELAKENYTAAVVPLRTDMLGPQASMVMIGIGAVVCVLLIACVNVINLMLARSVSTEGETGVRLALGAGRLDVGRVVIAEAIVVSGAAAVAGWAIGTWATRLIAAMAPASITGGEGLPIDWRVGLVAIGLMALAAVLCSWLPALRTSRVDVRHVLASGGRAMLSPPLRVMRWLVSVEVALAIVLLFGAGLLAKTYANLDRVEAGFRTDGVLLANASLGGVPGSPYDTPEARRAYFERLDAAAQSLPGVQSVGLAEDLPLGFSANGQLDVLGSNEPHDAHFRLIGGDYFRTLDIPVHRGRAIDRRDDAAHPRVAVINELLARQVFAGVDPIGRQIRMPGMDGGDELFATIVGVVADIRHRGPRRPPVPEAYFPYLQRPIRTWELTVVMTGDVRSSNVAGLLRDRAREIDPSVSLTLTTMSDRMARGLEPSRFRATLLASLGLIALMLAAVGVIGVASYGVACRRTEIGLRMALGATPASIHLLLLRSGALPIALGGLAGAVGALFLSRMLTEFLFDVGQRDLPTLVTTCSVLFVSGLAANWWPARRAARVDPMRVLRS